MGYCFLRALLVQGCGLKHEAEPWPRNVMDGHPGQSGQGPGKALASS